MTNWGGGISRAKRMDIPSAKVEILKQYFKKKHKDEEGKGGTSECQIYRVETTPLRLSNP